MSSIKRIVLSAFLFCAASAYGQVNNPSIRVVPSPPSGACAGNLPDQQVATLGTLYSCQSGTYGQIGSGGGSPVLLAPGASQTILNTTAQFLGLQATAAATSGANVSSPTWQIGANYWNGSVSAADIWTSQVQLGGGTNPTSTLYINHGGSTGAGLVDIADAGLGVVGGLFTAYQGAYLRQTTVIGLPNGGTQGLLALELGTAIAAAATIAPLTTVTHITGTAATVETITLPTGCLPSASQVCELRLISDAGFVMGLTGNIAAAKTTIAGEMYILDYDNNTSKWYPTDGGGGAPTGPAGGALSGTYPNPGIAALIPVLQNVQYLSAASEIGAQCNTAVTALASTGGIIQLPNSLSATMTTTCTNIPQGIWVRGYGKFATKIACSVSAGDCFQITQNPTSTGAIGGKFSDFEIDGASSANPTLIHGVGASGWTFDNVQFNPYGGSSANAATCLEFENNASGIFTERNTINPTVGFERQCTIGLYLHQDGSGDSSFAYNHFWVDGVSQGSNYLVVVDGNARPYGGWLEIAANHVGPGGGVLQFNGTSGSSGPLNPSEFLDITVEEDGSGAGEVVDATSSGTMNFLGTLMNGPGGAPGLATLVGGTNAANFHISGPMGAQGSVSTAQLGVATDYNYAAINGATPRNMLCPNIAAGNWCEIGVGHDTGTGNESLLQFYYQGSNNSASRGILGFPGQATFEWDNAGNGYIVGQNLILGDGTFATVQHKGNHTWYDEVSSSGQYLWFDNNANTTPLSITSGTSGTGNLVATTSGGVIGFSSDSQYANNAVPDLGLSRSAADVLNVGNGTNGDFSARIKAAGLTLAGGTVPTITGCGTISSQAGGATAGSFVTSTTGTCTAAFALPTVAHGYTCLAQDTTQHVTANELIQSATSTTGCTVTGTTVASDVITFTAMGW